MTCATCHRLNLPGGVRCSYCGQSFRVAPDFEVGTDVSTVATTAPAVPASKRGAAGLLTTLGLLLLKGKSLLTLLKAGALLQTLGSMAVFVIYLCQFYTWKMALGFAVCILVHEMGHVLVFKKKGLKATAPMFIPGFGALITTRQFPEDPVAEGEIGAGGPIAGLIASGFCALVGSFTGDPFWFALAKISFLVNLANMIPFWQLDGAHICSAFNPGTFDVVLIVLLLVALKMPVEVLWLVIILGFIMRLGRHG
ncbi:MAG: site-2 protease family protein, partial [Armatimonadota bacterium]|nr:site-2 protease family protein [Armatimonadota bacterium]